MSPQRRYQAAHLAAGLCVICPMTRVPGSTTYCQRHLLWMRAYKRRLRGGQAWTPGGRGHRPLVPEEETI